ncbi:interleukin-1 receptor type 1-like [Diretmus argenteus]
MGRSPTLGPVLLLFGLMGGSSALQANCTDYRLQFGRVYSVPGDMAMLNSTLLESKVFNHTAVPHNISWYNPRTGRELSNETGRILVRGETLWFLRVELEDAGEYVCIVRTPSWCYKQATKLEVDQPVAGECGMPRKANQVLTNGVNDKISCPLKDHMKKLDSYSVTSSIRWHKGCAPIEDVGSKFTHLDRTILKVEGVAPEDNGTYTCTLTFTLDGVMGSISETIDVWVKDHRPPPLRRSPGLLTQHGFATPQPPAAPRTPDGQTPFITPLQPRGAHRTQESWVWGSVKHGVRSVLGQDGPDTVLHAAPDRQRVSSWPQESPRKGVWLERLLVFSELQDEDFNINYTCRAYSDRGFPEGYFTLLPADPNLVLPIGLVLGGVAVLFVASVVFYYLFKIDAVLWFRRAFPVFYKNTDLDGKMYDAYVTYPRHFGGGARLDMEMFALHMLPHVLEKTCGYKLFIVGRDCLPGQAIVDSVEENIQASRRLLLLYTAHSFSSSRHNSSSSNNNNIPSSGSDNSNTSSCNSKSNSGDVSSSKSSDHQRNPNDHQMTPNDHQMNPSDISCSKGVGCGGDGGCPDARQQFECEAAMHRTLLEGSLKVVLVEMEEVTPAQLALLPESVRHLRKQQGAVCWWKNQATRTRWRTCLSGGGDEEKGGLDAKPSPSLSPSSRFWKEMRYHMPVRSNRAAYPEKMSLLTL